MLAFALLCLLGSVAVTDASAKIEALKAKINSEMHVLNSLHVVGPFKVSNGNLVAKISKTGVPVELPKERQIGAWNDVMDSASFVEAWAVSEHGLVLKQRQSAVPCKTVKGMDQAKSVAVSYTCLLETSHKPSWPVKTGYDAIEGQENPLNTPWDNKDDMEWDPRVRFWHRCAGGAENGLSMCNRYRYIGADSMGYYGCDYLTEDQYCVQSYRHDWMEFNPNDLPFILNPPSPCAQEPCTPCEGEGCNAIGGFAGGHIPH